MTVFFCEGFETFGTTSTSEADVIAHIRDTDKLSWVETNGGHTGTAGALIDDFEAVGLAYEFADISGTRGEWYTVEFPDGTGRHADYKVSTNSSVPIFCSGCRVYVPSSMTPSQDVTIFQTQTGATTSGATLRVASGLNDLIFVPASGSNTTISSVLTPGEWNYIEIEYKMTTAASGGYAKIFVDGSEVADLTSETLAGFTFFETWGFSWGCDGASNQTAGENWAIDDIYCMEIDGVDHTGPLGPSRVLLLSPNAEATPNDWSPSSGSDNTALIDETTWDTADYVEAATTGDDDHYSLDTLSADTVHGLDVRVVCEATDGTPNLHIGFDDGTADEEDMGTIATGGEVQKRMFFEVDPSGGAWSVADVNAVEATQRMTE